MKMIRRMGHNSLLQYYICNKSVQLTFSGIYCLVSITIFDFFSFLVRDDGDDGGLIFNFKKDSSTEAVRYDSLSPGESIWLLNLLISYEVSNCRSRRAEFQDSILLLDEPDANLHPSFIPIFFDTIKKYVNDYGVQVIMTTHNPETISLIPNDECLFCMERDEITKEVYIRSAGNKTRCIQLLTSNIVYINKPFRMVFVETGIDKMYFECINSYLIKHNSRLDAKQLIFVYLLGKPDKGNSITKNSSKPCNVRKLISILTESYNDTTSLENFSFGIVKRSDTDVVAMQNIQQLGRCSIENYVLDPINVLYYIVSNDAIIKEIPDITNVPEWDGLATKCRSKSIYLMLHEPDAVQIFQSIINLMAELLSKYLEPKENDIDVWIGNTIITLKYPDYFIKKNGLMLETAYTKLHKDLNFKNILKFIIAKKDAIIPKDLIQIFEYLHSSIPENRLQGSLTTS